MSKELCIYQNRFSAAEMAVKVSIWKTLCGHFFQRYVSSQDSILDLGSGFCEFINHIRAGRKFAVDINPASRDFAGPGVVFLRSDGKKIGRIVSHSLDSVFTSNFFEHIPQKKEIDAILKEVYRVLKPGGRFLILQPNIKYLYDAYWDFYDHFTPLSHLSMMEALVIHGFRIQECIPRFLPFTTKTSLPKSEFWVKLYLKLPFLWRFFGKQMFLVAVKPFPSGSLKKGGAQ